MSPNNGSVNGVNGGGGGISKKNFIEHHVSKMDTLAGVAIKYGVEVADIRRLNGLATDLQMFALKTLLIPLPGRHPPSPILAFSSQNGSTDVSSRNGIEKTPVHPYPSSFLEAFESIRLKLPKQKVSQAMSSLQNYYGLKSANQKDVAEGTEMAVYQTESPDHLTEKLLPKSSGSLGPSFQSYKARTLSGGFLPEHGVEAHFVPIGEAGDGEGEKSSDKSVRRRPKAEADLRLGTPEKLLKEESNGGNSDFSPATGKRLSARVKSASKQSLVTEAEQVIPVGLGDSIIADALNGVRKSSSTPSFQEQESSASLVWPPMKWSLKPEFPSLPTASINILIFDALPKPISGRRSKAALD